MGEREDIMLDIKRVLAAAQKEPSDQPLIPLLTPWGEKILGGQQSAWTHPRPQFCRDGAVSLNGWWDFCVGESQAFDQRICVPFSPEAALSGIGEKVPAGAEPAYAERL